MHIGLANSCIRRPISAFRLSRTLCLPLAACLSSPSFYDGASLQARIFSPWHEKTQVRGARKRTTLKLDDLPQGLLPVEAEENNGEDAEENRPAYPTVVQQARNNMRKFNHCVVLTRVGNFYELYFEQAEELGPMLNLKVAQKKTNAGPVYMAGFPFFQLDRFLKVLVQDFGKYVAISEEFPNDPAERAKSGGLMFDRKITRVITPGTLIDEKFMDPWENNFLLSIYVEPLERQRTTDGKPSPSGSSERIAKPKVGLAWLDLSSGDFFTQETDMTSLPSTIARIGPREIVLDDALKDGQHDTIISMLREDRHVITYHPAALGQDSVADWSSMLEDVSVTVDTSSFSPAEVSAGSFLLHYVKTQLQGVQAKLRAPVRRQANEYMSIDKNSLRALEIKTTLRDGWLEGSLLHAVRKTVTKSGARLLSQRLTSPSMSLEIINKRLDLVTEMIDYEVLREQVVTLLRRTFDTLRLVQKFSFGRGDADDLLGLSRTIQITNELASVLKRHITARKQESSSDVMGSKIARETYRCLESIVDSLDLADPTKLATKILDAIDEEGLSEQHRLEENEAAAMVNMAADIINEEAPGEPVPGVPKRIRAKASQQRNSETVSPKDVDIGRDEIWVMRKNASTTLQRLHAELEELKDEKAALAVKLREEFGAASLTLRWTPGLGHICHVKGKDMNSLISKLGSSARSVSSSKSTRSFHLPKWTHLGSRIDESKHRIRAEELRVFGKLRTRVIRNLVKLRRNASVLDELDVACSFATVANIQGLVRPILNTGTEHKIVGGRHPMVEGGLSQQGRTFTSNDCFVGAEQQVLLITGPNMGGKSTFLRQNALISILAQTGSFVPAEYAEIGLVDKIFSRVGSADNLYQDQSTFMVEMLETAEILKQATSRSFVIMDEVGRGTTPEDGIAVGFACLHHLYHVNQCRTLFATHFHALADMTKEWKKVACYCTDVEELEDGKESFVYVHRLQKGINKESHALKVARFAGMPEEAIAVAATVLDSLKKRPELKNHST
ncbi:putative DNA mismatch repair protein Msh1 [Lineolata rhizophorae]|uniref:Putative DNA mismatch repair protein Msh1 n=1 Tax=Lineolata rhizophorae TaxID=578093 RepID=A0A6A6NN65_9PEZI|nr:putative DNA mismatch repair protein Msh1 [Lineolata rhizophorae]